MFQRLLVIPIFLIVTNIGYAQYQIKGRILDSLSKTPIEYASIGVFQSSNSKVVNGVISDAGGKFAITGLKAGNYNVK